jgi:hypothetical protein
MVVEEKRLLEIVTQSTVELHLTSIPPETYKTTKTAYQQCARFPFTLTEMRTAV